MPAPKKNRANLAKIECVLGASGSGKTTYVMQCLRRDKPRRLLIWDTKGEFAAEGYAGRVDTLSSVFEAVQARSFAVAYRPRGDDKRMRAEFDLFCQAAFAVKRLTVVAEELADVTTASYAVPGWRRVSSQGRTEGITVYGLSQQPASIDKHFFANASLIRTGRLHFLPHLRTVSAVLDVARDEIRDLRPLEWIEKDLNTGELRRGQLKFESST